MKIELRKAASQSLEEGFKSPPASAKPHTWYHMMNGNITKKGVTRDFEAIAAAGIGGVHLIDAGCEIPAGPVAFNTPEWFDLLRHATSEARRLGLEIVVSNCSGWSSSGGPWITPPIAMKKVVYSETAVEGPSDFNARLPRTEDDNGFYEDIAVLAFPTPAAELVEYAGVDVSIKGCTAILRRDIPFTVQGVSFVLGFPMTWIAANAEVSVSVSENGKDFVPVGVYDICLTYACTNITWRRHIPFGAPVTGRALRVEISSPFETTVSDVMPEAAIRLSDLEAKTFQVRYPVKRDAAQSSSSQIVRKEDIANLTRCLTPDGTLSWRVPPGNWTILRIGHACNGQKNHPASWNGVGLEVDKLSAEAMDWHFSQYIDRVRNLLGDLAGDVPSGMNGVLVDSYEVGSQNWTHGFEKTFEARMGYSPIPFLPAFSGCIVESVDETERFLEDFRLVVADLFADNYAGRLSALCRSRGLKLWLEPYGNCPTDNLRYAEDVDVPMIEFWSRVAFGDHALDRFKNGMTFEAGIPAAHLGHFWGRKIVAAESFTSNCEDGGRWRTTPFAIKALGDRAYAAGVNRIVYHRFVHQPWAGQSYLPGMTMGPWGMHLDRTQTWWKYAGLWFRYQSRCQWMLQEGEFVADVLFMESEQPPGLGNPVEGLADILNGEMVPGYWKSEDDELVSAMRLPPGYSWDVCAARSVESLSVADGCVVAPSGLRYPLLVLPPNDAIGERTLRAVCRLLDAGAKVCCLKMPTRARGLAGYPSSDGRVKALAETAKAKGLMVCSPVDALKSLGIAPDFTSSENDPQEGAVFIHRRGEDSDWYFVALNNSEEKSFDASFRIAGRIPEIWDAEHGSVIDAAEWRIEGGRTIVTLDFPPSGSAFIVFRRKTDAIASAEHRSVCRNRTQILGATPWQVSFPTDWYTGGTAVKTVEWRLLKNWAEDSDDDVRHFSGTAMYATRVKCRPKTGERVILDLGEVRNFAAATVNGIRFPALWRPPYRVDITRALGDGCDSFALEVEVTNLWPNRLIGDDAMPADCEWKSEGRSGIASIPEWVSKGLSSPTGRHTFTTWRHWTKDDELFPSGLLGPVSLVFETEKK